MIYVQDSDFTLHVGDVRDVLRDLPAESVDCVVTSPPYWGLRDYGTGEWEGGDAECNHVSGPARHDQERETPGGRGGSFRGGDLHYRDVCGKCGATRIDRQLGLEPTPEEYASNMVEVFREVRRVLAPHGTCWVNLGDSYAANVGGHQAPAGSGPNAVPAAWAGRRDAGNSHTSLAPVKHPTKPKDLVGVPWRIAFALQADGWYLRSDIIWSKPNPMPESVTDRPTKAHEYVFLLTKSPRYFFDQEAVREQFEARPQQRLTDVREQPLAVARRAAGVEQGNPQGGAHVSRFAVQEETLEEDSCLHTNGQSSLKPIQTRTLTNRSKRPPSTSDLSSTTRSNSLTSNVGRNIRSVWEIATQPYPEAHFATYPEALVERCLKAGCPEQVCRVCGKPRERLIVVESRPNESDNRGKHDGTLYRTVSGGVTNDARAREDLGFTDCGHGTHVGQGSYREDQYRPGIVLDPFLGSGTTAKVARRLGRHCVGIELNETYAELAARRTQQLSLEAEASHAP